MHTKIKRRGLLASALVVAAFGVIAGSNASANLPGSTFEGGDGNFVVNTAGNTDWAALNAAQQAALSVKEDLLSGQTDNSFGNGTKTSDTNVTVVSGQIPNNKADLGNSYITSETLDGDVYMYLGVTRVTTSGTVNLDIEINKEEQPDLTTPGAKVLIRTAGDLLIGYDFQGGAQKPTLTFRTWTGSAWSAPTPIGAANGESEVNRVALTNPLAVAPSPVNAPAFTFGEASINLTGLGIIPEGECAPFSSAYVKSRASDAFTSAVKDFIAPQFIDLDNCGDITIEKVTDPASDTTTEFGFTLTGPNATNEAFNLVGGGSNTTSGLQSGTYVATEATIPPGWDLESATCSDGSEPDAIDLGLGESVTCTFTNVARANLHIVKVAERAGVDFNFTADAPLAPATFTLQNGGQQDFLSLLPGTYGTAEVVPEGWDLTASSCDNGDDPDAVTLGPGDDVTCTYTNEVERGALVLHKSAKHAAAEGGEIDHAGVTFTITNDAMTPVVVQTDANGVACVSDLPVSFLDGPYTITETLPAGYDSDDLVDDAYSVVEDTTCATASVSEFVNIPLTDLSVSVISQIDGGTASTLECVNDADPPEVVASGTTDANGDGTASVAGLRPGTYTCTVVIDP